MRGIKSQPKGWLILIALATLLMTSTTFAAKKRYVVTLKDTNVYQQLSSTLKKQVETPFGRFALNKNRQQVKLLNTEANIQKALDAVEMIVIEADEATAGQLLNNPQVASVEEEIFIPAPAPMAKRPVGGSPSLLVENIKLPWGIGAVKAQAAWSLSGAGAGARVMVLDTGLDKDHVDLAGRFEKGRDFVGDNRRDVPYPFFDGNGHGTHVSGTILADGKHSGLVGVAPEATLLMGRVCGDVGCSSIAIIEGVNWAISEKVSVVNMSLGGPMSSSSGKRAYERADAAGVMIIAASGNGGNGSISYPARYKTVFSVGAVDQKIKKAEFSQWGPELDIVAPGVDVLSSIPTNTGSRGVVAIDFADGQGPVEVENKAMANSPVVEVPINAELVHVGLGKAQDFNGVDVTGKIALIQRGEINFRDKVDGATRAGAIAVLIYNNEDGLIVGTMGETQSDIPALMITQVVGETLAKQAKNAQAIAEIKIIETSYAEFQGTSMAAPHVAGVAALVRATNPGLTPAEVRDVLRNTAERISPNPENQYGSGMIDAERAVAKASQMVVPTPLASVSGF